mgnify:CR=1 FL=1
MEGYKAALIKILKEEAVHYKNEVQNLAKYLDDFNCNLLLILSESQDFSSEYPSN